MRISRATQSGFALGLLAFGLAGAADAISWEEAKANATGYLELIRKTESNTGPQESWRQDALDRFDDGDCQAALNIWLDNVPNLVAIHNAAIAQAFLCEDLHNVDAAISLLMPHAKSSNPLMQHDLGFILLEYATRRLEEEQAACWFYEAVGFLGAEGILGVLYLQDRIFDGDPAKARAWLIQTSEAGYPAFAGYFLEQSAGDWENIELTSSQQALWDDPDLIRQPEYAPDCTDLLD